MRGNDDEFDFSGPLSAYATGMAGNLSYANPGRVIQMPDQRQTARGFIKAAPAVAGSMKYTASSLSRP